MVQSIDTYLQVLQSLAKHQNQGFQPIKWRLSQLLELDISVLFNITNDPVQRGILRRTERMVVDELAKRIHGILMVKLNDASHQQSERNVVKRVLIFLLGTEFINQSVLQIREVLAE